MKKNLTVRIEKECIDFLKGRSVNISDWLEFVIFGLMGKEHYVDPKGKIVWEASKK